MEKQTQTFGAYITELREKLGISKSELARRTGMTRGYIGFIEAGSQPPSMEPPNVGEEKLRALAKELGVSESEMFAKGYRAPSGFTIVPENVYTDPKLRPLRSLVREAGLDEKEFTESELKEMQSGVEVVIEGYAAKKKRSRL